MTILYSVVSRGTTVLAKHAICAGNFQEVTSQILARISPENSKLTYSHGNFLYHYVCENNIIFLCITDDMFARSRAFLFLDDVKGKFNKIYGDKAQTALAYAMNSEFAPVLSNQMKYYSENNDLDTISRVHGQLDELKEIMVKNIDNVAMRGERLELLINKAEHLSNSSVSFNQNSRILRTSLFWKNIKFYIFLGIGVVIVIYLIVSMFCGGLAWGSCVG